ncbi:hypothetical protein D3C80_1644630 [compost metagenome]
MNDSVDLDFLQTGSHFFEQTFLHNTFHVADHYIRLTDTPQRHTFQFQLGGTEPPPEQGGIGPQRLYERIPRTADYLLRGGFLYRTFLHLDQVSQHHKGISLCEYCRFTA